MFVCERARAGRHHPAAFIGFACGQEGCLAGFRICRGPRYRFSIHAPGDEPDPCRTDRLADRAVPTLIFRGESDLAGGAGVASRYMRSSAIRLHIMRCDHGVVRPVASWNGVAKRTAAFVEGLRRSVGWASPRAGRGESTGLPSGEIVPKRKC